MSALAGTTAISQRKSMGVPRGETESNIRTIGDIKEAENV